ncbi:MAG: hypothetical protein AABY22_29510 [Nanoarchaeota archaeon]
MEDHKYFRDISLRFVKSDLDVERFSSIVVPRTLEDFLKQINNKFPFLVVRGSNFYLIELAKSNKGIEKNDQCKYIRFNQGKITSGRAPPHVVRPVIDHDPYNLESFSVQEADIELEHVYIIKRPQQASS